VSPSPGTRVGIYEVTGQIGVGGMGEVYRARDTKLDRDVALKILPDAFAADPDRLARFQREAKTLADGRRFLMKARGPAVESAPVTSINLVLNWTEELKWLVPTK
jgi:hypothetical protein